MYFQLFKQSPKDTITDLEPGTRPVYLIA